MATTTDATTTSAPPSTGFTHRQIMTILSGLLLGMFLAALDQTVVSTAIYKIGDSLHGLTAQAWVTTAFLITSTISTPLYGKLSDICGRKPFFLFAISVFVLGSALCTLSTSMYMLAGFRAFQGIGAGGLFSLALAIIGDIIPPRERAKYQGYFLAVFGTSSVIGPVVGGALAGQNTIGGIDGWRWIFLLNVPIGVLALVVVTKVLHLEHVRRDTRIDYWGATALAVGLVPLLIVAEQGRTWGWGSGKAFACYGVGVLALISFVLIERHMQDAALLPPHLFRIRNFALGGLQSFIIGVGMFGAITLLPLYLQLVKGNSPTRAGLLTLPLVLGLMASSIASGQVTSRTGRYKIFPILGCAVLVAGMLLLWRISADTSLVTVDLAMVVVGVGLGMNMQTMVLAMQNAVPPRDIGVATSSATFFRQMGGTLGVAVFLSIVYSTVGSKITSAYHAAASTPAFQAAAATPQGKADLAKLTSAGTSTSTLNDTSFLQGIDAALTKPFREGFTSSLTTCFLIGAAVMLVAFLIVLFVKEVPLRTTAAAFSEGGSAGVDADADGTPEPGAERPAHAADAVAVDSPHHVGRHGDPDGSHAVRVGDLST